MERERVVDTGVINVKAVLQRKDPRLPVYVVIPYAAIAGWRLGGTTIVEGAVNGHATGRRSVKRWDASEQANWFLELTTPFCKLAGITVGDELALSLALADSALPAELAALLHRSPALRGAWDGLPEGARRNGMEHVRSGKTEATRARRAATIAEELQAAPTR